MKNSDFQQLNIAFVEHDKVWSLCPYHKDTLRPNLSISLLDRYYGRYKCWACGRDGCLSKKQMEKLNLSGFTVYKNHIKSLHTLWTQHATSCYDNLKKFPLLKLGLAKELNISTKSLDDWLVGYNGNSFSIPMYREDLEEYYREKGLCGIQRRFSDGSKRSVTGSHLGLMYSYDGIESDEDCIFICEGFSDGISVYDLGLLSIARPHCRYIEGIDKFFGDVLDIYDNGVGIIIVPDNDTVGMDGAKKLQSILEESSCDCEIFSFDGAKDIREYIAKKGKDCVRQELSRYV